MNTTKLKILSDITCDLYIDNVYIGKVDKDIICIIPLTKGEYWLQLRSTINPKYRVEQVVSLLMDKVLKVDFCELIDSHREFALDSEVVFVNQEKCYKNILSDKNITESIYEEGEPFVDGIASVMRNGLWGRVDITGKEVITCEYFDKKCLFKSVTPIEFDDFELRPKSWTQCQRV